MQTNAKGSRDMFDTMTMTKVAGALCGSLLVYMLGGWAAQALYTVGGKAHGDEHAQAYVIETGAEDDVAATEGPSFEEIYASADAAAGEKVFAKCKACHKMDGVDGVGPHLNGVVDRAKASIGGFAYSEVLVGMAADAWTPENLDGFLKNPKGYAPGTKMAFAGLPKAEERANVIAYLASVP
jgi:cytochrome c